MQHSCDGVKGATYCACCGVPQRRSTARVAACTVHATDGDGFRRRPGIRPIPVQWFCALHFYNTILLQIVGSPPPEQGALPVSCELRQLLILSIRDRERKARKRHASETVFPVHDEALLEPRACCWLLRQPFRLSAPDAECHTRWVWGARRGCTSEKKSVRGVTRAARRGAPPPAQ